MLFAVTEPAKWFNTHWTGRRQSIALRYRRLPASASAGNVWASRKSKVLITSFPFPAPLGLTPGAAPWVNGTVPAKKWPVGESNIWMTKSPAILARDVQEFAAVVLPRPASRLARVIKAANISALFSVDLPG